MTLTACVASPFCRCCCSISGSVIPGGYTGVDVFFVISGYVITKSIHHDIAKERFSIGNFYFKRFRRITPAFAATLLDQCCVLFSAAAR
jgi:peptidoglycan/LPS O-acetylase OafA/YrhL